MTDFGWEPSHVTEFRGQLPRTGKSDTQTTRAKPPFWKEWTLNVLTNFRQLSSENKAGFHTVTYSRKEGCGPRVKQKSTLRTEEGAGDLPPSIKQEAALRVKEVTTRAKLCSKQWAVQPAGRALQMAFYCIIHSQTGDLKAHLSACGFRSI